MQIIKIKLKENQEWKFKGCYILNLNYENILGNLSGFHFYTTKFLLNDNVKRICIQPLSILDSSHRNDGDTDIDNRLKSWFANNQQILKYGLDVLGQSHGSYIGEKMEQFLSGVDWDDIKIENDDKDYDEHEYISFISDLLNKEEVWNIIKTSTNVKIDDIFS